MDKTKKEKKDIYCRIWNVLRSIGLFLVIVVVGIGLRLGRQQFAASRVGSDDYEESVKVQQLSILAEDTDEIFEINLADKKNQGMIFEQKMGEKLQISGRKDAEHGYFEGRIAWNGQKLYVVNYDTGESVVLTEEVRSFMLGDYYVSCRYNTEKEEMELLIFYCP